MIELLPYLEWLKRRTSLSCVSDEICISALFWTSLFYVVFWFSLSRAVGFVLWLCLREFHLVTSLLSYTLCFVLWSHTPIIIPLRYFGGVTLGLWRSKNELEASLRNQDEAKNGKNILFLVGFIFSFMLCLCNGLGHCNVMVFVTC